MRNLTTYENIPLNASTNLLLVNGVVTEVNEPVDIYMFDAQSHTNTTVLQPIFDYTMIESDFSTYLACWFKLCSEHSRTLESYFGSFEATGIGLPIRVFLIAQSLERPFEYSIPDLFLCHFMCGAASRPLQNIRLLCIKHTSREIL